MIAAQLRRVASREEQDELRGILTSATALEASGPLTEEEFLAALAPAFRYFTRPTRPPYEVVRQGTGW